MNSDEYSFTCGICGGTKVEMVWEKVTNEYGAIVETAKLKYDCCIVKSGLITDLRPDFNWDEWNTYLALKTKTDDR